MTVTVEVYGTEILCASCVNLPSALETKEWLESLLTRKFPTIEFEFNYIDFENPDTEDVSIIHFCEKMKQEDMLYPIVKINNEIVCEGQVLVQRIYAAIKQE